jgi:hypothetical protein
VGNHVQPGITFRFGPLLKRFNQRLRAEGPFHEDGRPNRHAFMRQLMAYALEHMPKGQQ